MSDKVMEELDDIKRVMEFVLKHPYETLHPEDEAIVDRIGRAIKRIRGDDE